MVTKLWHLNFIQGKFCLNNPHFQAEAQTVQEQEPDTASAILLEPLDWGWSICKAVSQGWLECFTFYLYSNQ